MDSPYDPKGSAPRRPPATASPEAALEDGAYRVRFARGPAAIDAALRLRYRVFNLELGEGLETSHRTGRDEDPFDAVCDHLIVEERRGGRVIGTYRMQTRSMARDSGLGFYAAGEFDLSGLGEEVLERSVEIGRACIDASHRNRKVLFLLWRGLARYVAFHGKRYLFGCCSLTGTDPRMGIAVQRHLEETGQVHPDLRVEPLPALACRLDGGPVPAASADLVPRLFRTYLRYGALACGPPAIDRLFQTIDFLVIFDVERMDRDLFRLYF